VLLAANDSPGQHGLVDRREDLRDEAAKAANKGGNATKATATGKSNPKKIAKVTLLSL
jgi:hypothetical protein